MARNIKYQFNHCINSNFKEGMSKHSMKRDHSKSNDKIFSYSDRKNLMDVSANFSNFMKTNHPDVKLLRNITQDHVQNFLNEKAKSCSQQTLIQYTSKMHKLETLAAKTLDDRITFKGFVTPMSEIKHSYRDKSMSEAHLNQVRAAFQESKSKADVAIELAARNGLRVAECADLKAKDINLEKMQVEIWRSKGGRDRNVPIREKDKEFYENLKLRFSENENVCDIKKDSINKALRVELKRIGLDEEYKKTGIHSIRKFYAQERFDELRAQNLSIAEAWGTVSVEIGHSYDRHDLMDTYVKSVY